ncbi:MAG: restriction endonuclease [Myxacorys californica WJT36-NPBG1]|nr:restriction endonuclease [Myxacorys californica WJT36-NPBG1]
MEGAGLQSADLSNSSFDKANLKNSHIGLGGMILFPGTGNVEQYRTCIEGASFQGADFRGIHLDAIYRTAPNLQEPLKRVWMHEIESQLEVANTAVTNDEKKKSLETLTEMIIGRIPNLTVRNRDRRRLTDEIDLIVMNKSLALLTAGLGGPIFVECKNENKPVGSGTVKKLAGTIPHGGIGLIVTTRTMSKDAQQEMRLQMLSNASRGLRLAFWDSKDLEDIVKGEEPEDRLIERYYHVLSL